jgi:hypothetical protein
MELRQVRCERRLSSGDCIHWYRVQRKWIISGDEIEVEIAGKLTRLRQGRDEWRDLDIVDQSEVT